MIIPAGDQEEQDKENRSGAGRKKRKHLEETAIKDDDNENYINEMKRAKIELELALNNVQVKLNEERKLRIDQENKNETFAKDIKSLKDSKKKIEAKADSFLCELTKSQRRAVTVKEEHRVEVAGLKEELGRREGKQGEESQEEQGQYNGRFKRRIRWLQEKLRKAGVKDRETRSEVLRCQGRSKGLGGRRRLLPVVGLGRVEQVVLGREARCSDVVEGEVEEVEEPRGERWGCCSLIGSHDRATGSYFTFCNIV